MSFTQQLDTKSGARPAKEKPSKRLLDGRISRVRNRGDGIVDPASHGRCGVRFNPIEATQPSLEVTVFSDSTGPACVTLHLLDRDGEELTRSAIQSGTIELEPIVAAPHDPIVRRILEVCQNTHLGVGRLTIPESLRSRAQDVSLTISSESTAEDDNNTFFMRRQKCRFGLGAVPKPDYGFPLSQGEATERIEWLAEKDSLLRDEEWAALALNRVMNCIRGGFDQAIVTDDLATSPRVARMMNGLIRFAKQDARSASDAEPLLGDVAAPPADAAEIDPERIEWQRQVVESMLHECTPDAAAFLLVRKRLFEGESLKKLSDEFEINYPRARVLVHRAKKYLGMV